MNRLLFAVLLALVAAALASLAKAGVPRTVAATSIAAGDSPSLCDMATMLRQK